MKTISNEKALTEPPKEPFDYKSQVLTQEVQKSFQEEENETQQSIKQKSVQAQYSTKQNLPTKKFSQSNDPTSRNSSHNSNVK